MPVTVGGSPITPEQADQLRTALGMDPEPITARLTTLAGTDDLIALRASVPYLASLSAVATYTGGSPAATAPAAFTAGQWTAAATSTPGEISFNLTALPADGGSAITALEYRVNTGAAIAFSGTGTGVRVVTAGLTAGVAVDLQVRAVNAVGAGAWSDIKNRTPLAGGSSASYLSDTFTAGTDSITITRPAGAGSSHTLTAIVWTDIGGQNINTMAAPSGWTVNDGATNPTEGRSARVFTAPGDVSTLTFAQAGIRGVVCFATTANVRNTEFEGVDYSGPSNSANRATPAVTAVADDLGVSVYIQYDDGSAGPLVDPGTPQSGWTRRYVKNAAAPYISILSRASLAAGSTGAVAHDANGNFSGRFVFTGTYGA